MSETRPAGGALEQLIGLKGGREREGGREGRERGEGEKGRGREGGREGEREG